MDASQKHRSYRGSLSTLALLLVSIGCWGAEGNYYTEEPIYRSRPDPNREMAFGHIGVTGVKVRVQRDVTITVEETMLGSPADGKFKKGEIITGINGASLKGKNPFVTLGNALTEAEAAMGLLATEYDSMSELAQIWDTPEGLAARAVDQDAIAICQAAQARFDETTDREVLEDVSWVTAEMKDIIDVVFGCTAEERGS